MEDLLRIYRKELFERVGLKKTINKTNEQIILDNFKYFDLNGNNYSSINEFIRVNERIGVKMRKKDDLIKIFNFFDKNNSGVINYRLFTKQILGLNIENRDNYDNNNNNNLVKKNNYMNNQKIIEIDSKIPNIRRKGYLKRNMASYDNVIFNSDYDKYSNKEEKFNNNRKNNYINDDNNYRHYDNDYEQNKTNYKSINNNIDKTIPIIEQPFFEKIMNFLLRNNKNLPSKALLLFYKNFKIIQKKKSFNNITMDELIEILSKNRIDLYINNIHDLFNYYKKDSDNNFYYEKLFEDIINIFWNEERLFFSEKKIKEILYKYRNKDKVIELNKIRIEDFYHLISITKNNNYNIIPVNNYFRNKLNIINPDEYYNEIVNIFMEIKYLTTANKDSTITSKDILQLIKFISFGIKSNEDFYTAINYIFNTNKYAILNKEIEKEPEKRQKNMYEKYIIKDKYNYNTSLSSLITIRKYMINKGIDCFIKFIKRLNYYSSGRFVKKYDFAKIIKDFNILINVDDIEQIFDNFSGDKNKLHLNYCKFIDILLSEFINKERIELINQIYEKIEKKLDEVNFDKLRIVYNPNDNYYIYEENDFFENLKNFHYEFYLRKLPEEQRKYYSNDSNNFRISNEEFLDFYKMISFMIEKDEIFENIIKTEWKRIDFEQENEKEKEYLINNDYNEANKFKNKYNNDDYDDYDEYDIKPKEITNYKKLKNDLSMKLNYNTEQNYSQINNNHLHHNHNHNKKEIINIPIPLKRKNSNEKLFHNNINTEQNRIFRPNSFKIDNNNSNNGFNENIDNYNNISPLEKLSQKLKLRGLRGLMNLHKQFIFTCPNLSKITLPYFIQVLKNQKINLSNKEYSKIFSDFSNNNETLDFPGFIRAFKKPLNDKRLSAVEDAFSLLDADSNDNIYIETIKKKYNPKGNPLVKSGKKNEEEIATEFLDCFELNYNLLTAVDNQNVTNLVSFEEFANFYEYVSFLYDNDDEFVQMVNESWTD